MRLSRILTPALIAASAVKAAPIPLPHVSVENHHAPLASDSIISNTRCLPIENAKNFQPICEYWETLAHAVKSAPGMPVVLGGDHALETGVIRGLAQRNNGTPSGVVYFDAHADINSPKTSPSGNVHGMDLYFSLKEGNLDTQRLMYVGMRHPDPGETKFLEKHGIPVITTDEVHQHSVEDLVKRIHDHVGTSPHISFDVDVIDKKWVPGTGTPEPHGITPQQAFALVKALKPSSLSLVEVDPERDHHLQTVHLANQVVKNAVHGRSEVTLISSPMNLGQPHPGTALGPDAMLNAGLPALLQERGHTITLNAVPVAAQAKYPPDVPVVKAAQIAQKHFDS